MNDGIKNEINFVKELNGKKVCELNPMFSDLINNLFDCSGNEKIICFKNDKPQKADIFIMINSIKKAVSIKMGAKNSVHVERISDFIHFLICNGVPRDIVIKYLEYHYADGTRNGSGLNRLSVEEYKKKYNDEVLSINAIFNKNDILLKSINRFIIRGKNADFDIDALIYGETNDFLWITKDDIKKIILSKINLNSTGVHFGCLSCQPKTRNLNYNPKYEKDRFCVQIKWFSLFDDIIEYKNNQYMNNHFIKT